MHKHEVELIQAEITKHHGSWYVDATFYDDEGTDRRVFVRLTDADEGSRARHKWGVAAQLVDRFLRLSKWAD